MKYIYIIKDKNSDKVYYVGQTSNLEKRFKQHMNDIDNGKHSVKQLNKVGSGSVECIHVATIHEDNSLLTMMIEALYNSALRPLNAIVWRSGRNTVRLARCDIKIADALIDTLKQSNVLEEVW